MNIRSQLLVAAGLMSTAWASISADELRPPPVFEESSGVLERFQIAQSELAERPANADALAQLGASYRELGDPASAARLYRQAAETAILDGEIRFTRELSELFVELRDHPGLVDAFAVFMEADISRDPAARYVALVDFADGLASLDDESAWGVFEESLQTGANNIEAINRYSGHLLDKKRYAECLDVLNRLTPEQRMRSVVPAYRYRDCESGLGVARADAGVEHATLYGLRPVPFGVIQQESFDEAAHEELPQ